VLAAFFPLSRLRASARSSLLRYGKLQSFFSKAIASNTFLRKVLLTLAVSSSAGVNADQEVQRRADPKVQRPGLG
jgi:hypothetical protein